MEKNRHRIDRNHPSNSMELLWQTLIEADPSFEMNMRKLLKNHEVKSVLDSKLVVLIKLIIDVSATHLYAYGVRQHIQHALALGLTRIEILEVFKLASVVGIHSCALGVPILATELNAMNIADDWIQVDVETPICDELKLQGNFNPLWETLFRWDPEFLEDFLKMSMHVWKKQILPPLWVELLCIAGDITLTHMWALGTKRHIQAALALGAQKEQILEVIKIVSLQGFETLEMAIPILDEEMKAYLKQK